MYTYKNISDQELMIPNVGLFKPGETINSEKELVNSNLQLVTTTQEKPKAPEKSAEAKDEVK